MRGKGGEKGRLTAKRKRLEASESAEETRVEGGVEGLAASVEDERGDVGTEQRWKTSHFVLDL
jgi:hypothetical protein